MHIPDGFLDTKTWVGMDCVSTVFIGAAVRTANKKISEKHIPLLGVMAAFVFAAQMFNFPVGGGTSGHFMREKSRILNLDSAKKPQSASVTLCTDTT